MVDAKSSKKFQCLFCDYYTSRKGQMDRHNLTAKHIRLTHGLHLVDDLVPQHNYICDCGKQYNLRQSLWKHKQICDKIKSSESSGPEDVSDETELKILTNLVKDVIKQNQDLTNKIIDICKTGQPNNISNSNIHSNNKTFNLQFFLNETCKDAMNIMDFVDSIKLQLTDLENVGKLGYVDGISKIIVSNLNSLDETKRPVHCTDSKREVMYVKDEDKWEKENESKQKMRKVIKHVAHKNTKLLKDYKTKYPGCEKSESKYSEKYDKLIIEAFGGKGDNDDEKENKIIRNIAKEVTIDK
jgi:hypothetical protein